MAKIYGSSDKKIVDKEIVSEEIVDKEIIDKEIVSEEIVDKEIVNEEIADKEIVNKEIVNDNIEKIDDFVITYVPPAFIDGRLIFAVTITNKTGVMFNGNMLASISVENENVQAVKAIVKTIINDTKAAKNQLEINKNWYK